MCFRISRFPRSRVTCLRGQNHIKREQQDDFHSGHEDRRAPQVVVGYFRVNLVRPRDDKRILPTFHPNTILACGPARSPVNHF